MTVTAGVDVGNATTEVVLARSGPGGLVPVAHRIAPTRGDKGDERSLRAAAELLHEAERGSGERCRAIGLAPLHAVDTLTVPLELGGRRGPVIDVAADGPTPAGAGRAVGAAWPLTEPLESLESLESLAGGDVIAAVGPGVDFERAASIVASALEAGARVVGVVCAGDDAVLIANRLPLALPIVDQVDVAVLIAGERVAVDVSQSGGCPLADAFAIAATFGLAESALPQAAALARELSGRRAVALVVRPEETACDATGAELVGALRASPPGPRVLHLPGEAQGRSVADAYAVALEDLDDGAWIRRGIVHTARAPLALLTTDRRTDAADRLARLTGRQVHVGASEEEAAAAGARSTPGCPADAMVCDVGGGTIDLVGDDQRVVGAGAGELLTLATSLALGCPRSLAEIAKRGPALRAQTPHLAHDEDGRRRFLDTPVPAAAVGRLCVVGDHGVVALSDALAPEEWHALRLALKRTAIADNVARLLRATGLAPRTLVLAGGVAEDREVVAMVAEVLRPAGTIIGRANVAGRLGPRAAVAWGLAGLAADEEHRHAA